MSLKYLVSSTSDIYRMRQCSIVLSRYRGAQQAPHLDGSMVVGKGILHNPLTHNVRIYGKQGVHCTCRCGRVGHPHTPRPHTRDTRRCCRAAGPTLLHGGSTFKYLRLPPSRVVRYTSFPAAASPRGPERRCTSWMCAPSRGEATLRLRLRLARARAEGESREAGG